MTENLSEKAILATTQTVKVPIPFFANLAANANMTVVANPISVHYKIVNVEAHFRDDTANNLRMYVFAANNRNISTTTPPPDDNVVSSRSPTPFLVGEGEIISLPCDYEPAPNYQYIKVYFGNSNAYAMTGFCVVTIEAILQLQQPINTDSAVFKAESEKAAIKIQAKGKAVTELINDVLSGSPSWVKDYQSEIQFNNLKSIRQMQLNGSELEQVQNFVNPNMDDDQKAEAYKSWFSKLQSFQAVQQIGLAAEGVIGSILPGGLDVYRNSVDFYNQTFPITAFAGQINSLVYNAAWGNALLHKANEVYTPNMPDIAELTNEVVKEVIPLDDFKSAMKKMGYADFWSQRIWDAHFIQPAFEDVKRAAWKGAIKHEEIEKYLKLVDLDPRYNESVWFPLLENTPNISDLNNMRTKEVIDQKQFDTGILAQGYSTFWGSKFWDAHFSPAQFNDFLTAMRRKETVSIPIANQAPIQHTFGVDAGRDQEIIKQLSILADYDSRYWDFFKTRMYNDPSYRMLQWGYEGGSISKEAMPDLVHRLGLNPKDEQWYGEFITHFQERPWITKYLTALATAYIDDAIDGTELKNRVLAIPRNSEIADWIIKIADVRKEIQSKGKTSTTEKLISIGELKQMRMRNMVSNEEFASELLNRGYSQVDVDKMIELITAMYEETVSGGEKTGLTIAELFDAFRYNQMDESTLTTNLMQRGMNLNDVTVLISTKKLKWGVEP